MRQTVLLLLFGCFIVQTMCRPSPVEEARNSEEEQTDYEGAANEAAENDDSPQEDNARLDKEPVLENDEENPGQAQQLRQSNRNPAARDEDQPTRDNFPGYKSNRDNEAAEEESVEDSNANNDYQSSSKQQRQNNRYNERNDINEQEAVQRLLRRDGNNSPRNDNAVLAATNEEGDLLFENNENSRDQQRHSNQRGFINDAQNANAQFSKRYYNTIQEGVPDEKRYEYHDSFNRNRRALQQNISEPFAQKSSSNEEELEKSASDDEEATIKEHVKKLSGEELEELMNSLSADKRELLKKIMESDVGSDINKREITKKAGAAPDENGYLESGQQEASKLQEGSAGGDTGTTSTDTTESSKQPSPQPDISLPVTKTLESSNSTSSVCQENTADLTAHEKSDNSISNAPAADSNNEAKVDANINGPAKSENKRETNLNDNPKLMDSDFNFKDDPNYFCSQDEDLSQLMDEMNAGSGNMLKREALFDKDSELSDSMKSLEESFPNSNAYDDEDPYSGSDMAPLVRVKRKNSDLTVKKRSAGILPDAKVAFFPYRAEHDDEDNEEGNEFDDEGFYDRTAHLGKSALNDQPEGDSSNKCGDPTLSFKPKNKNTQSNIINRSKLSPTNKLESDTAGIGTDTDSVLSGGEGIDDNLMYNSGTRSRRVAGEAFKDDNSVDDSDSKASNDPRSKPFIDIKSAPDTYAAPNFHENDAFGSLPRSYEGELGRYKRIRRVKQPSTSHEVPS